jgi:hypothetical protein
LSKVADGKPEQHEQLLRAVNNLIRRQFDSHLTLAPIKLLCECGAADCHLTLELTAEEYDRFAAAPESLLLAREHVGPLDGRNLVAEHERFVVLAVAD